MWIAAIFPVCPYKPVENRKFARPLHCGNRAGKEEQRLEKKISLLTQQQISLAEKLAKVNESLEAHPLPEYDVTDSIEQQINKAREKVFSEWIQNIANYTPFKNGE